MDQLFNDKYHKCCLFLEQEPVDEITRFFKSLNHEVIKSVNFELLRKANLIDELERLGKKTTREYFSLEIEALKKIRTSWLEFNPQNSVIFESQHEFTEFDDLFDLLKMKKMNVIHLTHYIDNYSKFLEQEYPEGNILSDSNFRKFIVSIYDQFNSLLSENSFKLNESLMQKLNIVENSHKNMDATPARLTALLFHAYGKPKTEKTIKIWYKKIKQQKDHECKSNKNLQIQNPIDLRSNKKSDKLFQNYLHEMSKSEFDLTTSKIIKTKLVD